VLYPSGSCSCKWLASISIFLHPFYANVSTCPPPGTGILSFGLVAIPVRIHTATHSENVSFHLLDNKCGSRVRNQHYCPVCNVVVERAELVRGFQHAKTSMCQSLKRNSSLEAHLPAWEYNVDFLH
jgi:Ku70/Ku80 beta-barrel domain